ncbi:alpha-L-arabinofuranosidase C-terminal domain-containing protein [Tessaracoccus antarcticus]|uniref:alpha-L-arabinofuranosidase C-terminal domain-containing protein n=1 Tax=Tessaracoccus antarcticus TaxID=2479848 RepID=UPI0018F387A0|nr:alpha-L-arabinofuranosidase C-terminal domain-containing protein [Tessaracoccus antarcticus]
MMAVNLGTRGLQEALDLLEYCNVAAGSHWAEQRRRNGTDEPYRVKLWCLGNEMDGPWQIGHKPPQEYGRIANATAQAMRMIDPSLELVICGSSSRGMPSFGDWERLVLTEAYDAVDMISAHAYYWEKEAGLQEFLISAEDMDRYIHQVSATADGVAAARKSDKVIGISFDEWNVWYLDRAPSNPPTGDDWPVGPRLLEDNYSIADAVVVGNLLISLLRHTDRVWSASQAQLVNVIAPIMAEPGGPTWKQTIFHPFALTSAHAKGNVLQVVIDGPTIESKEFGTVQAVDAVATWDTTEGALFLVNRHESDAIALEIGLPGGCRITDAVTLNHDDPQWKAGPEDDTTGAPQPNTTATLSGPTLTVELPPISWTMIKLSHD